MKITLTGLFIKEFNLQAHVALLPEITIEGLQ
jgi:hypothetical protein